MKKIAAVLFLIVILTSGCRKNDTKNIVKFMSWGSKAEVAIIEPILADFEKQNPDAKVEFIHVPQNYFQKLHLMYASKTEPDVIFINNIYFPVYCNAGRLENLSPYFETEIKNKTFFRNATLAFSDNDKLYAIPRDISNMVIYYNKDLFEKYHVQYPERDWTMQNMLETAGQLTKDVDGDGKTDIWGISYDTKIVYWLPYLLSNGGGILGENGEIIINSPNSIESLQFYSDLANNYHVAPTQMESSARTQAQMFINGQLAMYVGGRWNVPTFRRDVKFEWDVINFPQGSEGSIVSADASGWAISKSSKNKENAIKLIKFLSSKDSIARFTLSGLIVPARFDVAYGRFFIDTNQSPDQAKIFLDIIDESKPVYFGSNYREIEDILNVELETLFRGANPATIVINEPLVEKLKKLSEI